MVTASYSFPKPVHEGEKTGHCSKKAQYRKVLAFKRRALRNIFYFRKKNVRVQIKKFLMKWINGTMRARGKNVYCGKNGPLPFLL